MSTKTNEPKSQPLLKGPQLVANPHLITVQTIKPSIVDQMQWIDGNAHDVSRKPVDLSGVEIVGALPNGGAIIVRGNDSRVYRLRTMAYIIFLMETQGMDNPQANAQVAALPQLFAA